jgi:hypothetical protein
MRIKPEVEADLRRTIRDERAKDPLITAGRIKEALEKKYQRGFSYQYVARLVEKVARESMVEIDRAQIEERMAFTRENYRMMREQLLKIVYWTPADHIEGMPKPLAKDRVEAAKSVVQMDLALLQAEAAAGLYKKPIAEIAKDIRYDPLPGEVRAVIVAAWERGGMLPKAAVEEMVPEAQGLENRSIR